jgi:ubiquinone/menaquinone biosynthesis C-methylase UbiE
MSELLREHYTRLAEKYDDFLYYSPKFVRTLTRRMIEKLALQPDDVLLDLACGTGMYSLDILKQIPLKRPVQAVDPFAEMLAAIPHCSGLTPVCMDALAYSAKHNGYTKAFMKEAVHHVNDKAQLFANVYESLPKGGVFLLVHVPPTIQYPLFDAAVDRALYWHACPDELRELLRNAGFEVEHEVLSYLHSIPKSTYFAMVESQYMTVLSSFSDEELAAGLQEMERRYADTELLEFFDHFDYITARKS